MRVTVVVGNPKRQSRTLSVATAVADAVAAPGDERLVVDLADSCAALLDWGSVEVQELSARVAASQLLVVASPTFKATYAGLLKVFLDRYATDGLAGVVAVPVMTGAGAGHALAPDTHLRPLLVELGASVPTRSVYVTEDQLPVLGDVVAAWSAGARPVLDRILARADRRATGPSS